MQLHAPGPPTHRAWRMRRRAALGGYSWTIGEGDNHLRVRVAQKLRTLSRSALERRPNAPAWHRGSCHQARCESLGETLRELVRLFEIDIVGDPFFQLNRAQVLVAVTSKAGGRPQERPEAKLVTGQRNRFIDDIQSHSSGHVEPQKWPRCIFIDEHLRIAQTSLYAGRVPKTGLEPALIS